MAIFSKKHYELFAKEIATEPQYEFPMSRKALIEFVSAIFECDNPTFKAERFNRRVRKENQPMTTLAQHLRETIMELDQATTTPDADYRAAFSTYAKMRLRRGETWRNRLIAWCEREEAIESNNRSNNQ